jgi:rhodanese-related sulfurtransferase
LGAALDILNAAANTAENMIEGRLKPLSPEEFSRRLAEGEAGNTVFMDLRAMDNAKPYLAQHAPAWTHLPQETLADRLAEVPRDKDVVLICNSGVRSYEAQCTLNAAGFGNTYNLSGGVAAVKKWGDPILNDDDQE